MKFFEIPNIDAKQCYAEALDVIDQFLKDPDNSDHNKVFGVNEPTAVLKPMPVDLSDSEIPDTDSSLSSSPETAQEQPSFADSLTREKAKKLALKVGVLIGVVVLALLTAQFIAFLSSNE